MFKISKNTLIVCALLALCALPGAFLRDLSASNELNILAMAQNALDHGKFFFFDEASFGADAAPPLYYWLCMAALLAAGAHASVVLLLINVALLLLVLIVLERTFAPLVQRAPSGSAAMAVLALPAVTFTAFAALPWTLYMALTVFACCALCRRCDQALEAPESKPSSCRIILPLLMCLLLLCRGFGALLVPFVALFWALLIKRRLKLCFFKVLEPWMIAVCLLCAALWAALALLQGGAGYTTDLFVAAPLSRLDGSAGHAHGWFYLAYASLALSLPLGLCAIAALLKLVIKERSQSGLLTLFALALPLSELLIFTPCVSKSALDLLPALPFAACFCVWYLNEKGSRDGFLRLLLVISMLPFTLLLPAYYFFYDDFAFLDGVYVVCALLAVLLFTLLAVFKVVNADALTGIGCFGAGILCMVTGLGFSVPLINPYLSPRSAVDLIEGRSHVTGVLKVCVTGVPHPKALEVLSSDLIFEVKDSREILHSDCTGAFRFIGRAGLRDHAHLRALEKAPGAQKIGDSLVIEPNMPRFAPSKKGKKWY
ncbi:MAG: hypothetical protein SPL30_07990 [Succinivibrio sp.]|nr:hypothetical protein [Succinivibrio sp.]